MNNKSAIAIGIVVIIAIAAVVVYISWNDDADPSPVVKEKFEVGDYYETTTTSAILGETFTSIERHEITGVNGDMYTVVITADGIASTPTQMTKAEFLEDISLVEEDKLLSKNVGSEVISTNFGKIKCDIWEVSMMSVKGWICPDNNILFRAEGLGTTLVLTSASIFV